MAAGYFNSVLLTLPPLAVLYLKPEPAFTAETAKDAEIVAEENELVSPSEEIMSGNG
jgi:hypothetical protein